VGNGSVYPVAVWVGVEESDFLYSLSLMLVGFTFISEEKLAGGTVFMVSDFGWTIYLSSMGDNYPASVIPEQLFVVRGTNEQGYR